MGHHDRRIGLHRCGAITGEAVWSGVPVAVWAFLSRLLHGMSTGFRPTGTTAFLTDITPLNRRGEALGYLGVAGMPAWPGPAIGSWLTVEYGYNAMFIVSTLWFDSLGHDAEFA